MKDIDDTICALSTPPGRSGIAVVRMSGLQCFSLFRRIFITRKGSDTFPFRRAVLGRILDPRDGSTIDEALVTCFSSPHSYTGEDMVEFSLHGSPVLAAALLDCLCSLGARLAVPGEFTLRAFLHGRIDLTQAEAVRDIIDATTLYQAQIAERQHAGALANYLRSVKELLIDSIVTLESAVEFEEEQLPVTERDRLAEKLDYVIKEIRNWIKSYRQGRIIREGFSIAVVGRPNVGKSSVFNALLAQNRSIVAEMSGTTRDLVSELTNLGGIPVRLLDTAGIRHTGNHVERMGVGRSLEAIADADAVLLVVDASRPRTKQDVLLKEKVKQLSCITVFNKMDLPLRWSAKQKKEFTGNLRFIEVSAKTGSGIGELRSTILNCIIGTDTIPREGILITNLRHCHCLEESEAHLEHAYTALKQNLSEEFVLTDLHAGLRKLGEITGETHVEDLLGEIFSRFCIGK